MAWPAYNGVTTGLSRWWATWLLSQEGEEHRRLRQLMNPAFSPGSSRRRCPGSGPLGITLREDLPRAH
ncbi:MAG TPA: hypothetical protein VGJ50_15165 [Streptosporangiaceae bacterium]